MTPGGHTLGNTPFPPRVRDLVLEFKKGVKLDPASFAVLKDNKQWDSVHRTLKAQTAKDSKALVTGFARFVRKNLQAFVITRCT
jgi:hypothetical protein